MKDKLYVTNEDGVIVDEIEAYDKYVKLSDGDKVIRKGVLQYLSDTKDIKYKFIKVNPIAWSKVALKYPIINKLIYYLGYMDGILSYRNNKNIQMKDISKICDVSESTAKRQLSGLIKDDVIHKIKNKKNNTTYLMVNPFVVMRGKRVYLTLYEEFAQSKWRNEIDEWDK